MTALLLGGESIGRQLVERTYSMFPRVTLWNLYGPTEATANATIGKIVPGGRVTLGRPLPNVEIFILDSLLQPVPIGVPGELYIGGRCLARGYLNRPELTAEKFITHSFDGEPARRFYKTGDLARYLPDGNIEFLGRIDDQVKIRGYRIELGEIESVLVQHPSVGQSVVAVREDSPGDKRLVAYIVALQNPSPPIGEFREYLRQKLPEYMIPSAFVFLEFLPLTPNGKVDRKALPVPDQSRPELQASYQAPRTPVEELLAEIWTEVLRAERIGIHDNFFDLGGHSLLATQVVSRMRRALQLEIPLRALFETPTVAGLAKRIEEIRQKEQGLQTPPILPVSRDKDLPLSFAQQRLWFLDQLEPGSTVYNIPGAVRIRGQLNVAVLEQSLNEIVRRHEALRTTFSAIDGDPVQIVASSLSVSLPVVDLNDQAESEREKAARRLAREEARRPFDLARGPLVRATLISLAHDDHVLLLSLHHIVSDGWSMGVLYRELSVLYQAFTNSQPSPLPDLPIQYADYSVWQREWLKGEELERQISYWKKQLEGIPAILNLPTDRGRSPVQSHRGARQSFVLSKDLTEQLKAISRKEGVTLFMTLIAAFQTLLYRYTGQDDLVIGSPIAGRNRPEIEGLIGFFVNTLVLRTDLSANPSFRELMMRVREVCLAAYAHQELPFQKLVEVLHPKRDTIRRSLVQVAFAFQNFTAEPLKFPGLSITPVRTDLESANVDLTLFMRETAEGLAGSLNYAADLFDAVTISRMMEHFQTLLNAFVADPERRLLDLPPSLEQSRSELLEAVRWVTEQSWHFETGATTGREQGEL
jgi:acyl carrier protein